MTRGGTKKAGLEYDALYAVSQILARVETLPQLLHDITDFCQEYLSVDHIRMVSLTDHKYHFHPDAVYPVDTALEDYMPETLLIKREAVYLYAQPAPDAEALSAEYVAAKLKAVLLLPLIAHGTMVGFLELGRFSPKPWNDVDLTALQSVIQQIAVSIALFQLEERTQRRSAEIATINDIAATITSTLDPRQVYRLVVQKINEYFNVEAGSLLLLDPQTEELVFVMTLEAGSEKLADVRVPPGQGFVGEAIRTRQPVLVTDAQNDPRFYKKVSEDVGFITRSVLCVPMFVKGREIGVIQLLNKLNGEFTEEDAERLSAMANTIAVAIDNANLFQEVAQNRNRLQAILNSTEDGILTIDTSDVVLTANPMIEELFGLRWQNLAGKPGSTIMQQIADRTRLLNDQSRDQDIVDLEVERPTHRFVRQVRLPVYSANNEQIGQLIVFHDITQEHELARMREDYTGMLVHDLRAPLTAIINGLTMVRRGFAGDINEQQRELLDLANNSSLEMIGMINTLLDISKMESGQLVLNREPCSVYDIVERAVERIITSARSAKISITQDLALNLPIIDVDQDKLVRVLQNLLDNAIKFTPVGGEVIIRVRLLEADQPHGPAVCWSVVDAGPGIPEEYLARIFDKFVQVGQRKGTGLGLAFAKLATEAHGGAIWVESVESQGSTFSFVIPYALV